MFENRILIVDNDILTINLLSKILEKHGYSIVSALNATDAINEIAKDPSLRLIITDLMLPLSGGLDFIRDAVFHFKRDFEFIVMTSSGDKLDMINSMCLGFYFLHKPINNFELESSISFAQDRITAKDKERERIRNLELSSIRNLGNTFNSKNLISPDTFDEEIIERLSKVAQFRDIETSEHCKRVGLYAEILAKMVGLSPLEQIRVRYAGRLHDIGKVAIPDFVLLKSGPLNDIETEIMKTHTEKGYLMLQSSNSSLIEDAAIIAKYHHEKWNGTGYCFNLQKDEIPLYARLISIADVYDAIRSPRRYKPKFSHEDTLKIMTQGDNRTNPNDFDPLLLALFSNHHREFEKIYEALPDELV